MSTFAESPPPPPLDWPSKSYIASRMHFLASVLWIALGLAFLAFGRSYWCSGPKPVGLIVGLMGAIALTAGVIF